MFHIGEKVKMSKDALDNYGNKFSDVVLTIESAANKYMPAKQFFDSGMPVGYHPGYDESMKGIYLYDLAEINFSLYDWEIQKV